MNMRLITIWMLAWGAGVVASSADVSVEVESDRIVLRGPLHPILTYHTSVVPPPAGEDPLYQRSGFIHPLRAPNGDVVTGTHPSDHIHHMGLWHAWVKTEWQGRELDFWNLKKGLAKVRYVETLNIERGEKTVGFTARQQQVALPEADHPEVVVLEEALTVRASAQDGVTVVDYTIEQTNVTEFPLEMPAYRYGGGIAFRAPENWGEKNDAYLTSTGLDRTEGHATRANWVLMQGPTSQGNAAVVIMSHPSNHDSPQRVRIWPKGKVFFNYVPAQEHAWAIQPGETITLRYRLLIWDQSPANSAVDIHWQRYQQSLAK
ncbi:MAG: hypothetical protein SynsKO_43400 [Synoicihabitans sp.]